MIPALAGRGKIPLNLLRIFRKFYCIAKKVAFDEYSVKIQSKLSQNSARIDPELNPDIVLPMP